MGYYKVVAHFPHRHGLTRTPAGEWWQSVARQSSRLSHVVAKDVRVKNPNSGCMYVVRLKELKR